MWRRFLSKDVRSRCAPDAGSSGAALRRSPGAAIIGAVLMVAFRIVTAQEALRAIETLTSGIIWLSLVR